MLHRKDKKKTDNATQASVKKEMAKPRMARSARIADLNMNPARIRQRPSAIMPGTVDKIIASPDPRQQEKAQIGVDGADRPYRELRIENSLTASTATIDEDRQPARRKIAGRRFGRHHS
jgi:hypothetical protein